MDRRRSSISSILRMKGRQVQENPTGNEEHDLARLLPTGVPRRARSVLSFNPLLGALLETVIILVPTIYFIAFGALVLQQEGQLASLPGSKALLEAALYVSGT